MKLKWKSLLVVVSLFLLIETIQTVPHHASAESENAILQIDNAETLHRDKRFVGSFLSVDTMLTKMTNVMGFFGMDTSGIFQLQNLYNSAFSQQHLLFKRKILNLIMRTCNFILAYLPEEPVQENPMMNSLKEYSIHYRKVTSNLNQVEEDSIPMEFELERPEIITQQALTTESVTDNSVYLDLETTDDGSKVRKRRSTPKLTQKQLQDINAVVNEALEEALELKSEFDKETKKMKRSLHLTVNWQSPFYVRKATSTTTRKPVYVQKNFRFGLNWNRQVNHDAVFLRKRRDADSEYSTEENTEIYSENDMTITTEGMPDTESTTESVITDNLDHIENSEYLGGFQSMGMTTEVSDIDVTTPNEFPKEVSDSEMFEVTTKTLESEDNTLQDTKSNVSSIEKIESTSMILDIDVGNVEIVDGFTEYIMESTLLEIPEPERESLENKDSATLLSEVDIETVEGHTESINESTTLETTESAESNTGLNSVDSEFIDFATPQSTTFDSNLYLEIDTMSSISEERNTEISTQANEVTKCTKVNSDSSEITSTENMTNPTEIDIDSEAVTVDTIDDNFRMGKSINISESSSSNLLTTTEVVETPPSELITEDSETTTIPTNSELNSNSTSHNMDQEKILVQMGNDYIPAEIVLTHTTRPNSGNENFANSEEEREEDPAHQLLYLVDNDVSGEAPQEIIVDQHMMTEVIKEVTNIETTTPMIGDTDSETQTGNEILPVITEITDVTTMGFNVEDLISEDAEFVALIQKLQNLEVLVNIMSEMMELKFDEIESTTSGMTMEILTTEYESKTQNTESYEKFEVQTTNDVDGATPEFVEATTHNSESTIVDSKSQTTAQPTTKELELTTERFEENTILEAETSTEEVVVMQNSVNSVTTTTEGPVSLIYPEGYTPEEVKQLNDKLLTHKNLKALRVDSEKHIDHLILKLAKDVNIADVDTIMDNIEHRLDKHDQKLMVLVRKKKMDEGYFHNWDGFPRRSQEEEELLQDQLERLFHQVSADLSELRSIRQAEIDSSENTGGEEESKEEREDIAGGDGQTDAENGDRSAGNMEGLEEDEEGEKKLFVSPPISEIPRSRNLRLNDRRTDFGPNIPENSTSQIKEGEVVNGVDLNDKMAPAMMIQNMKRFRMKMRRKHNSTHVPHKVSPMRSPEMVTKMPSLPISEHIKGPHSDNSETQETQKVDPSMLEHSTSTESTKIAEKPSLESDKNDQSIDVEMNNNKMDKFTDTHKMPEHSISESNHQLVEGQKGAQNLHQVESSTMIPKMTNEHSKSPKPHSETHGQHVKPHKIPSNNHNQHDDHHKKMQNPLNQHKGKPHTHRKKSEEDDDDDDEYYDLDDIVEYFIVDDDEYEDSEEDTKKTAKHMKPKAQRNKRNLFNRFRRPLNKFYWMTNGEHFQNFESQYSVYPAPEAQNYQQYTPYAQHQQNQKQQEISQDARTHNNEGYRIYSAPYPPAFPVYYQKYDHSQSPEKQTNNIDISSKNAEIHNTEVKTQNRQRYQEIIQAVQDHLQNQLHKLKIPTNFLGDTQKEVNMQKHKEITKVVENNLLDQLQNLKRPSEFSSGFGPNLAHAEITRVIQINLENQLQNLKKHSEFLQNSHTSQIPKNEAITTAIQNNLQNQLQNIKRPSEFTSGFGPNLVHAEITKVIQNNLENQLQNLKKHSEFFQNSQISQIPKNEAITIVIQNNLQEKIQNIKGPSEFTSGFGPNLAHIEITKIVQDDLSDKLDALKGPSEFKGPNVQAPLNPKNAEITYVIQNNLQDQLQNLKTPSDFKSNFGPNLAHAEITKVVENNLQDQLQNLKNPSEFVVTSTAKPDEEFPIDIRKSADLSKTPNVNTIIPAQIEKTQKIDSFKPEQLPQEELRSLIGEIEHSVQPLFKKMQNFNSKRTEIALIIENALRKKFEAFKKLQGNNPQINQITHTPKPSQNSAQTKEVIYSYTNPEQGLSVSSVFLTPQIAPQINSEAPEKLFSASPATPGAINLNSQSPQLDIATQNAVLPAAVSSEKQNEKVLDLEVDDVRILIRDEIDRNPINLEKLNPPTEFSQLSPTHTQNNTETSIEEIKEVAFETLSINQDESKKAQNLHNHREITKVVEGNLQNEIQKLKPYVEFTNSFAQNPALAEITKVVENHLEKQLDNLKTPSEFQVDIQNSRPIQQTSEVSPTPTEAVKPQKLSLLDRERETQKMVFLSSVYNPNAPKGVSSGKGKDGLYLSSVFMPPKIGQVSASNSAPTGSSTTTTTTLSPIQIQKITDIDNSIKEVVSIFSGNGIQNEVSNDFSLTNRFSDTDPVAPPLLHFSQDSTQNLGTQNIQIPIRHHFTTARDDADDGDVLIFSRFGEDAKSKPSEAATPAAIVTPPTTTLAPPTTSIQTTFITSISMVTEKYKHFKAFKPKNNIVVNYIYKNLPKHAHPKGFFQENQNSTTTPVTFPTINIDKLNAQKVPGPRRGDIIESIEDTDDDDSAQEEGTTAGGEELQQDVISRLIKTQQDLQNHLQNRKPSELNADNEIQNVAKNVQTLKEGVKNNLSNIFGVTEGDTDQAAILAVLEKSEFGQKIRKV